MAAFKDGHDLNVVEGEILTSNISFYTPSVCSDSDTVVYAFDCNGKRVYPFINSKSFSWLTMAGIYHGNIVSDYEILAGKLDHSIIDEAKLIP